MDLAEFTIVDEKKIEKPDNLKIIFSGRIKKFKFMAVYDTRQLILYENGLLAYFNPSSGEKRVQPCPYR